MSSNISDVPVELTDSMRTADSTESLVLLTSDDEPKLRSVIYDKETNEPISYFFPKTPEYNELANSVEDLNKLQETFSDWVWCESFEGTIVRLFHYNGEWRTSTKRRISAYNSYWGSNISFGEMFDEFSSEISRESLNKDLTYTFLLTSNSHNRLVCAPSETPLIFTGTFDRNGNFDPNSTCGNMSVTFKSLESYQELVRLLSNLDISKTQGFLGYNAKTGEFVKFVSSKYEGLRHLRNNESDLRSRYLRTLHDPELHRRFREHFSEHSRLFRRMDGSLHNLARSILHGNTLECDTEILEIFNGVKKSHKSIVTWLGSLTSSVLWNPVIYRLKNCRNTRRDTEDVTNELANE
jgi:hypothetical protein